MREVAELFRNFIAPGEAGAEISRSKNSGPAPRHLSVQGLAPLSLAPHLLRHNGFPLLDWHAVQAWLSPAASEDARAVAWNACERAWLLHMRDALGAGYCLDESGLACVLSTLDSAAAGAALACMNRAVVRVERALHGIACIQRRGREILIVFDDAGRCRDYAAIYSPAREAPFAPGHAMHIRCACNHHAMVSNNAALPETAIVREIARGCLAHLPLPPWLAEGLARTAQRRVDRTPANALPEPQPACWGAREIQEFWSGASFRCGGAAELCSCELARLMVETLAQDWPRFTCFVLHARQEDGGAASAQQHLGMDLGQVASALLRTPRCAAPSRDRAWSPDPERWRPGAPHAPPLSGIPMLRFSNSA